MHAADPAGWVLYDDGCGVCRTLASRCAGMLKTRGLDVAPLQSDWVGRRLSVPSDELLRDVRLLLADGRHVAGADVYRHVARRFWWGYPLFVLSVVPGLRQLVDRAYRAFADHRHLISRACRVPDTK